MHAPISTFKKNGQPEILTINGQAEVVVQSASAYQDMLDKLNTLEGIRRGLESMKRGDGRSIDSFFENFESTHSITR